MLMLLGTLGPYLMPEVVCFLCNRAAKQGPCNKKTNYRGAWHRGQGGKEKGGGLAWVFDLAAQLREGLKQATM